MGAKQRRFVPCGLFALILDGAGLAEDEKIRVVCESVCVCVCVCVCFEEKWAGDT